MQVPWPSLKRWHEQIHEIISRSGKWRRCINTSAMLTATWPTTPPGKNADLIYKPPGKTTNAPSKSFCACRPRRSWPNMISIISKSFGPPYRNSSLLKRTRRPASKSHHESRRKPRAPVSANSSSARSCPRDTASFRGVILGSNPSGVPTLHPEDFRRHVAAPAVRAAYLAYS